MSGTLLWQVLKALPSDLLLPPCPTLGEVGVKAKVKVKLANDP